MKRINQFKIDKIDYKKLKTNKAYFKSNFKKIVFFYIFNKYSEEQAFYHLWKNPKYRNQIHTFIKFFKDEFKGEFKDGNKINFSFNSNLEVNNYFKSKFFTKKCLFCGKEFVSKTGRFCSIDCLNKSKVNNKEYLKNLSSSLKNYYKNEDTEVIKNRHKKVSESLKDYYKDKPEEFFLEKNKKTSEALKNSFKLKNVKRYKAFDKIVERLKDKNLELLTSKDKFHNNLMLKFKCKKCNKEFEKIYSSSSSYFHSLYCIFCENISSHSKPEFEIFRYFENQNPLIGKKVIYPYELDIYFENNNLAIEYDGLLWHSYGKSNWSRTDNFNNSDGSIAVDKNYHLRKTEMCEKKGIQLLHIFENEWLDENKKEIWKSVIKSKLGIIENKIYARKCKIKEVQSSVSKEFLEKNHLQGNVNAGIKIGLFYNDELVSLMTIGKSRFSKKYQYELLRFANKINTSVIGAFSKLLKYFERTYNPENIVSYANRRWSNGNVYKVNGFSLVGTSSPNYFYFQKREYILHSRIKFQKHKLKNLLEDFNPKKTELENMIDNGYRVIYDCGNKVYLKEFK